MIAEALEPIALRTRRLPCLSYAALVRDVVENAERPTVDLPVAPAPAPRSGLKGNGSPVIQPGYRLGQKPGNAGKKFPPTVIPPEDVRRLLAATPRSGGTGRRNRALIVLLYRTGLRISEALALYPADVDHRAGLVTVRKGKGGKSGFAAVDQPALEYLDVWLAWRGVHKGIDRHCPVFCTIAAGYECRSINSAYVRRMLKQLAARAGVERRVTPHAFRHSLAAGLMDEGADIRVVSKQLRHSNIAVTANYVDHLPAGRVLDVVRSRPWPLDDQEADRG